MSGARLQSLVAGVLVVVVVALLAWAAEVALVVFAGVLVALFLRTVTDWIGRLTGARDWVTFAAAVVLSAGVAGVAAWLFAGRVSDQFAQLVRQLPPAIDHLRSSLEQSALGQVVLRGIEDAGTSFSGSGRVVPAALSFGHAAANVVVALFIGLFLGADPSLYRRGVLALIPVGWHARAVRALEVTGRRLQRWLLAQVTLMLALGAASALGLWLVGMPIPVALGLLTGVLVFVPYLGAIAAFAITVAIALAISPRLALEVAAVYLGIHVTEAYVLAPLLHWDIVLVPPALTLAVQTLMFLALGIAGLLLATPMTAAAMALVQVVYVEGVLGAAPVE